MITWESCGECCVSAVCNGHYTEARPLPNGDWHVDIIRTSDGRTAMQYNADTLDTVKLTAFELMRHTSCETTNIIDIRNYRPEAAK